VLEGHICSFYDCKLAYFVQLLSVDVVVCSNLRVNRLWTGRSTFVTKIRMQKNIGNLMTRLKPHNIGTLKGIETSFQVVISLFEIFSKYLCNTVSVIWIANQCIYFSEPLCSWRKTKPIHYLTSSCRSHMWWCLGSSSQRIPTNRPYYTGTRRTNGKDGCSWSYWYTTLLALVG
jgi:hypothetical protein